MARRKATNATTTKAVAPDSVLNNNADPAVQLYLAAYDAWRTAREAEDAAMAEHRASEFRGSKVAGGQRVLEYRLPYPAVEAQASMLAFNRLQQAQEELLGRIRGELSIRDYHRPDRSRD